VPGEGNRAALRAVVPFQLHIAPADRRDLAHGANAAGSLERRPVSIMVPTRKALGSTTLASRCSLERLYQRLDRNIAKGLSFASDERPGTLDGINEAHAISPVQFAVARCLRRRPLAHDFIANKHVRRFARDAAGAERQNLAPDADGKIASGKLLKRDLANAGCLLRDLRYAPAGNFAPV